MAVGSGAKEVSFEVRNTGDLPVDWKLLFRAGVEIEMENWVALGEPATALDAHRRFIVENKVLTVAPHAGRLEPGEAQTMRVAYRRDFEGTHRLDALLHVSDGKRTRLDFTGRTVPRETKVGAA